MRRPATRRCVGFGSRIECSKAMRTRTGTGLGERFPVLGINVGLAQDASQSADRNLVFLGTMAVSTPVASRRTNFMWLPFWVASINPAASRRRLTSWKGTGLSRPHLDLDGSDVGRPGSLWRLEVELQRLFQIGQRFLFGFALAGDVNFEAL